uniref:Orf3 protein n=1 Tax=Kudoa septempunctata TaxID=751907 RepID=A0A0H5B3F6_9CNID|nr:orf3 protein [Kudoa septempunctata]
MIPLSLSSILSWDVWFVLFVLEVLLFWILMRDGSFRSPYLFLSYGPWLICSLIFHSTLCLSWFVYWHKGLSWIWSRWCEVSNGVSKLSFLISFDASLFFLTSSQQIWWSGTVQPIGAYWGIWSGLLFLQNTASWSLVFFLASGALALEAFSFCPTTKVIGLIWFLLPWMAFFLVEENMSRIRSFNWLLLSGMNLSPIVLQEYYWLLLIGQSCLNCLWPWLFLFCWIICVKVVPVLHQNVCYFQHFRFVILMLKIWTFCFIYSVL